jgi:K(+)-stimulated pyrophosphate-energized sodium pump
MQSWIIAVACVALGVLILAAVLAALVVRTRSESEEVSRVLELVHAGAVAFASAQYSILYKVVAGVAVIIACVGVVFDTGIGWQTAVAYVAGALVAGLAGHLSMLIATRANGRTATVAATSFREASRLSLNAGAVAGMVTTGFGLLGVSVTWLAFKQPLFVTGFALGVSSFALFARVGGGIFAKGADVGSALSGTAEAGVARDDLRNPGVIADNVGDNVGGVTGMGADVCESYVASLIGAVALGVVVAGGDFAAELVTLPLVVAAAGLLASLAGLGVIQAFGTTERRMHAAGGVVTAMLLTLCAAFLAVTRLVPGPGEPWTRYLGLFYSLAAGVVAGGLLCWYGAIYTSPRSRVIKLTHEGLRRGPEINLLHGLAVGMGSVAVPATILGLLMAFSYFVGNRMGLAGAGWYAVSLSVIGMLSTATLTVAMGAYGPINDNADGIAKMTGMSARARERTERLDFLGTETASMARTLAIAAGALTSVILVVAYFEVYRGAVGGRPDRVLPNFDLLQDPELMIGLLLGGALPFVFMTFTLLAVSLTGRSVVEEVRRQFREIPELLSGGAPPDLGTCVSIAMKSALKDMLIPGLLALLVPLLVGVANPLALGGVLVGASLCGFLLATAFSGSGGAWHSSRLLVESLQTEGSGSEGDLTGSRAAAVGGTVGDPLKDVSGPSLITLTKLMAVTALVFAPAFAALYG